MYLKNLTMLGFKSFADKTSLNFLPGVTAIVGPNGCGKSNVADAVRWVLGEQSAKALRGDEMADVIFNGTDRRKPMGLAEVSLTIGGVDQAQLKAAGVELLYDEVTITRRVFRDGTSEYFLNKTPCRLKDIQQLFMGTGVGRSSYSIMAQGNITQLLSSKPEDRRAVFEEAAGISKYKAQRREALRKLEQTEQNLVRIADLLREVKRQLGSLHRQAGRARRQRDLLLEVQRLDTQLARHQFDVLQSEIGQRLEQLQRVDGQMQQAAAEIDATERELNRLRAQMLELEHQISQAQQHRLELKNQTDQHQSRIQFNHQRLRELGAQQAQAQADIAQAQERRRSAEAQRDALAQQLAQATATLEQHRRNLEARRQAVRQLDEALHQTQEAIRAAQAEAFDAAQRLAALRNQIAALDLQKQANAARHEKLSLEKIQLEQERAGLQAQLAEFAAQLQAETQQVQSAREALAQQYQRLEQLTAALKTISAQLDEAQRQQAEQSSRLAVLHQLEAEHEGFSPGALAALKAAEQGHVVLGSLADKIRVADPFVPAIEAALGHHLQLVLTEQPATAEQILAELRAQRKGRASIAPMALHRDAGGLDEGSATDPPVADCPAMAEASAARVEPPPLDGQPFPALAVVEADPGVWPLLQRLLGSTRIVADLPAATAAWQETRGAFDYVTLAGDLLSGLGIYTGGSSQAPESGPGSILARKNQIAQLQASLAKVQEQLAQLQQQKAALTSEQTQLQAAIQQGQTELRTLEVTVATHQGQLQSLENALRVLHQKIDTVVYELESLNTQAQEAAKQRQGLIAQLAEAEATDQAARAQLAQLTERLEQVRQQREAALTALSEARVVVATQEQVCAALRQQQQPVELRLQELAELTAQRQGELALYAQRKLQLEAQIQESHEAIGQLDQAAAEASQQVAGLEQARNGIQAELNHGEERLRTLRQQVAEWQQQRSGLEVELAQKQLAVEHLRQRIQERYRINLDDVPTECITITFADEGQPKVTVLSPEQMAAAGLAPDWDKVAEHLAHLQQKLEEMGPVNPVAIQEYEATQERYRALSEQYDDLVKAKAELMELIQRINTQTRAMFAETFQKIREHFRALFSEVFGGGSADLVLCDESDVLESGIEILARPPGKQLRSISLLSGGEQTMTAVALLFAIYEVKPSPFCLLDELDAALDEANINRFVRLLQRFVSRSQFILITHNKRTIGMADVLYGITMQEPGVSKVVSVKFHKAGEPVPDHRPVELETPVEGQRVEGVGDQVQTKEQTLEVVSRG
jgi:chromosome segregation protein